MAKNTNEGHRKGAIKERSQVYNPKTEQYVKRDASTGRFLSASNNRYKGVELEVKNEKEKSKKK